MKQSYNVVPPVADNNALVIDATATEKGPETENVANFGDFVTISWDELIGMEVKGSFDYF